MLGRLSRIVLLARDFDVSLRFYRDTLQLPLAEAPRPNWAVFDVGGMRLCLHGPWEGMPFDAADFGRAPDELLFHVKDVDEASRWLRSRGVDVQQPHQPAPGLWVAEFRDPDGRRVAIESRVPE